MFTHKPLAAALLLLSACHSAPRDFTANLADWQVKADAMSLSSAPALPDASAPLDLEQALALASTQHPDLQNALYAWRRAIELVPQATALPDPVLNLGGGINPIETRNGPIDAKLALRQSFPWFGVLDSAGKVAALQAESARWALEGARRKVRRDILKSWAELAWQVAAESLMSEHLMLLQNWESVATTRYSTGNAAFADVLRLQSRISLLNERLRTLRALKTPLQSHLNRAVGATLLAGEHPLPLVIGRQPDASWGGHPSLLALEAQQNANAENIQLARLKNKPKFTVGLEHTFIGDEPMAGETSGDDATALVFGMTLPISGARNTSRVEQAKAMLSSVRQKHIARSQELQSQWAQAVFAMDEAARRLRLHQNELIPREQQILATLEESYRTTGASFLDLTASQERLLAFETAAARAASDEIVAAAQIENLSGLSLLQ